MTSPNELGTEKDQREEKDLVVRQVEALEASAAATLSLARSVKALHTITLLTWVGALFALTVKACF